VGAIVTQQRRSRTASWFSPRSAAACRAALLAVGVPVLLADAYLLTLLAAAAIARATARAPASAPAGEPLRFAVLVPAHDEEDVIGGALASLRGLDYPRDRFEIVVVADNCGDSTAEVAAATGATVFERHDPLRRGKGYAIAWALERLRERNHAFEALAVLDADCTASPNLLHAFDARLRAGAEAVQSPCIVSNPEASHVSALRLGAFALSNLVRPLGKTTLGLSGGLHGTGMALTSGLLERHPWTSVALAEDIEYHLELVTAGHVVAFAPEAFVATPMPTTQEGSGQQQMRWETGRLRLVRRWVPRLVARGVRERDPAPLHAALDLLVPPQSLLAAATLAVGGGAVACRSRPPAILAVAAAASQAAFVVGGLALANAPATTYRALLGAPSLMVRKLALFARILRGGGASTWIKADRPGIRR
jgi:glycosyl transferase family 2